MTITILCFLLAVIMIIAIHYEKDGNPNGVSISVFQKLISLLDYALCRFRFISFLLFSSCGEIITPKRIERIVWFRLFTVSVLSLGYEFLIHWDKFPKSTLVITVLCIYVFLLQISMVNSLLKPLFGVKRIGKGREIDQLIALKKTIIIPTPKRSLLLALVNLSEIIISWGIIYRSIMPNIITTADKANYFSIVTITTLGYGEINGSESTLAQLAVSLNMIIFIIFSVCHITTILGTITNKES